MNKLLVRLTLPAILIAVVIAGVASPVYRATHRRFTYVLVHGAFGGGWGFRQLDAQLTADGQKVFRPTLTGQGERMHLNNPTVDLNTHIQDVINLIEFEDLHDVVLVGHSYGGMVVTGVADRIPQRIKCVIYLDAIVPENGETEWTADSGALKGTFKYTLDANGGIVTPSLSPNAPLPHDEPEPAGAFDTPISLVNQDIARAIPTTYLLYVPQGKQISQARFYPFYRRAMDRHWKVATLVSDHNAQWSHPRELADFLENAP